MLHLVPRAIPITAATADAALVGYAQRGHAAAFKALFERHAGPVRRFLRDLLRDETAADDATQESFARAYAQLSRLVGEVEFKPWVLGIARNVAFEARRLKVHTPLADVADFVPAAVIPSPDPESVLLDGELAAHLAEALEALSPTRRAALLLRLDHGLSYEDVALAMGWSVPTVKNELHRARLKLRQLLLPYLGRAR